MSIKSRKIRVLFTFLVTLSFGLGLKGQEHPNLILTKEGVTQIRGALGTVPLFDTSLQAVREEVDAEIKLGIDVPIPKDYSGGYTHERHKRNFFMMQKAGVLFQILDDEKYAIYVRDMLLEYAELYPTLPLHPKTRSYARGKLFWQCLNDSNWLVYTSQAYDCVHEFLSKKERKKLEEDLFKPFADFISIENPQFFNRVHNHSTWGNAAVGMIGLVMRDDKLVDRALNGIKDDGLDANAKDNDGGFIKTDGKAGFFANLEEPFSPDGYYTEGPYYQRYAMYPFLIFAVGLQNVKPELKIFEYKDGVLLKGVDALINLSNTDGDFFPINDAQKGMSYYNSALVNALDITYHFGGNNPQLLDIAQKQESVVLDDTGLAVALGIKAGKTKSFDKESVNLSDGSKGKQGGIAVLREDDLELVFKYTAQGLSHGHYDKLSFMLYEDGVDVLQDYGMARFVNIEQKGGGNYLKENKTWSKQTIAHNTLVQNETSHFNGKYEIGSKHHSDLYTYSITDKVQIISATEANAYPGTLMHRTMVLLKDENFEKPLVLDILKVDAEKGNQYDLPFNFLGQVIDENFDYETPSSLKPLGNAHGYQHLYLERTGKPTTENAKLLWLRNDKFYSLTTVTDQNDELLFTRIGAKDPDFNLRRDASLILRRKDTKSTLFASVIESHGGYSAVSESALNSKSNIKNLEVVLATAAYTAVKIETASGAILIFAMANKNPSKEGKHKLTIDNKNYEWTGSYYFK